tara:strand:+ start:300 stop:470 length:171 start_codon:yes stop_codon:yes gene_type:complete
MTADIKAPNRILFESELLRSFPSKANSPNNPNRENQMNVGFSVTRVNGARSPRNPR